MPVAKQVRNVVQVRVAVKMDRFSNTKMFGITC